MCTYTSVWGGITAVATDIESLKAREELGEAEIRRFIKTDRILAQLASKSKWLEVFV